MGVALVFHSCSTQGGHYSGLPRIGNNRVFLLFTFLVQVLWVGVSVWGVKGLQLAAR